LLTRLPLILMALAALPSTGCKDETEPTVEAADSGAILAPADAAAAQKIIKKAIVNKATPPAGAPSEALPPKAKDHCRDGEKVYFSCSVDKAAKPKAPRVVSLCGSPNPGAPRARLQYRFGAIGSPELEYPADGQLKRFEFYQMSFARSWGRKVSFEIGSYGYSVRSMFGSSHPGEAESNNFKGVDISRGEAEVASLSCVGEIIDELSDSKFPWEEAGN
jgi:hypothetical protein